MPFQFERMAVPGFHMPDSLGAAEGRIFKLVSILRSTFFSLAIYGFAATMHMLWLKATAANIDLAKFLMMLEYKKIKKREGADDRLSYPAPLCRNKLNNYLTTCFVAFPWLSRIM